MLQANLSLVDKDTYKDFHIVKIHLHFTYLKYIFISQLYNNGNVNSVSKYCLPFNVSFLFFNNINKSFWRNSKFLNFFTTAFIS